MKLTNKLTVVLMVLVLACASKLAAQIDLRKTYMFSMDSIAGFDEVSANLQANQNNAFGDEYKVFMYYLKRDFIKQKYNLKTKVVNNQLSFFSPNTFNSSFMPPGGACNNEDFELATSQIVFPAAVQGWTIQSGTNQNGGGCFVTNYFATNNYTVFTGPTIDPKIPFPITSYFDSQVNTTPAGHAFLRLNNDAAGGTAAIGILNTL
jgi:hypothetical protein